MTCDFILALIAAGNPSTLTAIGNLAIFEADQAGDDPSQHMGVDRVFDVYNNSMIGTFPSWLVKKIVSLDEHVSVNMTVREQTSHVCAIGVQLD